MCVRERIQTSGLTTYNIIRRAQLNGYWTKMGMKLRGLLPRIRSFRQGRKKQERKIEESRFLIAVIEKSFLFVS